MTPNPPYPPFPPMAPPPMYYPPPPRRGGLRTFLIVILLVLLIGSALLNIILVGGMAMNGRGVTQSTLSSGERSQTVAVIPVRGMILDSTAERFAKLLGEAENDSNVKAVVIAVDTPGGSVSASDEIYHRMEEFKHTHPGTPLVVAMGGLATSGGYYVACEADYIFAQPTTWTGNIGVLMPQFNLTEMATKLGLKETTITAPRVGFKNAGSMFEPTTPKDEAYFQGLVDGAYQRFMQVIKAGRGQRLKKPIEQIADGKALGADEALKLGLVDQIGYLDDATQYAAKQAGLSNPMVVNFHEAPSLLDLLTSESKFRGSGFTASGINVNIDAQVLEELATPRPMYLWAP
jgi:protease-4